MKKIMSILLAFCLILSVFISLPIQAEASNTLEISTGGTAQKVTYTQNGNSEEIRIYSSSKDIVRQYVIPPEGSFKNYRLVFEILNASVSKTIMLDVKEGSVVQIRMANMSDPQRTNVVVETSVKPVYKLGTSSDGKSIVLTLNGNSSSNAPAESPSPTPKPSSSATLAPSPSATVTPKPQESIPVSSAPVSSDTSLKDPVITKNGPLSWSLTGDTCKIELSGISLVQATVGNAPRFEIREKEKLIQITIPGNDKGFIDGFLTGNSIIYGVLVNYNLKQDSTIIRISYSDSITYSHTVSGGNSIFLIKKGSASVPVNSPAPSATPIVTPKPTPSPSATPVPSNSPSPSANPQPSNTTAPANIKAGPGDGKTALRLIGSGIVNKYNSYKDKIITDDTEKGSVTFMIPVNIVNLGTGTLTINDDLVKSVTTFTSAKNSFITIEKTNPDVKLEIIAGSGPDELYVSVASVMAPVSGSKVVVLDPGHGGKDPGAVFNGCKEKDYNLDISLRCEAILKSKGVNVHMTRSTDVYVSLEDRYKFANDLNATLFVSIHNNSMPNGMKGSMVLYHYTSYKGKAYATLMLDNLVKDLKTANLGLSARQNTVVLRDTKMPAILAEVACMSDPADLALLNTEAFIQKAAESLAESIIQILSS